MAEKDMTDRERVRVRFAPSPTGKLHLGSARTAVFNWLYARHTGGSFILRIEDTDLYRSEESFTESIKKDMAWLGMDYDEFYRQSERFDIYRSYAELLISKGKAYYCTCSRDDLLARLGAGQTDIRYDRFCAGNFVKPSGDYSIRLDIGPGREITFPDAVKNKITLNTEELDDFVIMKCGGTPTYNFAAVVDDSLMNISHVIRGEDHITNTFKQIILYEFLGFSIPVFAHLPLVLDKDKSPLSKRKGSVNIEYYRANGILPDALLNAIARLGWSHGNEEIFTVNELIDAFDITKLSRANAVYDQEKMIWICGKHMKMASTDELLKHFAEFTAEAGLEIKGKLSDGGWTRNAIGLLHSRHKTLKALYDEMLIYAIPVNIMDDNARKLLDELLSSPAAGSALNEAEKFIGGLSFDETPDRIEEELRSIALKHSVKFGDLAGMIRIKLTGRTESPGIAVVISLLGREMKKRLESV